MESPILLNKCQSVLYLHTTFHKRSSCWGGEGRCSRKQLWYSMVSRSNDYATAQMRLDDINYSIMTQLWISQWLWSMNKTADANQLMQVRLQWSSRHYASFFDFLWLHSMQKRVKISRQQKDREKERDTNSLPHHQNNPEVKNGKMH